MKKLNYDFKVPPQKQVRFIVHTDCKNEADDQFALVHVLMTPKFVVEGIVAGHFDAYPRNYGKGNTAKASAEEVLKVLKLMDMEEYKVVIGAEEPLTDEKTPINCEGVKFIIEQAMKEDDRPLFVAFQGAITDLASAILIEPKICDKMTAIWIGGGAYPNGGFEFNLMQDIVAANVVMKSQMPLWQIPINVYKQMAVSLAELQARVKPCGDIGNYLFTQMVEFNDRCADIKHWPHGETWGLGDSPVVSVLLEETEKDDGYEMIKAPIINLSDMTYSYENENREIRVYKNINTRMTMEDFYAKLKINYFGEL